MTYTHISHLGLAELKRTDTHLFLGSANLGYVKRIAFVHGFEIAETRHQLVGGDSPDYMVYSEKVTGYHLRHYNEQDTALIIKWNPQTWSVMMPLNVWNSEN